MLVIVWTVSVLLLDLIETMILNFKGEAIYFWHQGILFVRLTSVNSDFINNLSSSSLSFEYPLKECMNATCSNNTKKKC